VNPIQATGDTGEIVNPLTLTATPVQVVLSQLALTPFASYQSMATLDDVRPGMILCILASTDADPRSQTTACLAPHRVASAMAFQV